MKERCEKMTLLKKNSMIKRARKLERASIEEERMREK